MKNLPQLLLLVLLTVAGCKTGLNPIPNATVDTDQPLQIVTEEPSATQEPIWFKATIGEHTVTMTHPPSWEAHHTPNKAILTERSYTLGDNMASDSLSIAVFLPSEHDMDIVTEAANPCMRLMEHVVSSPSYIGQSTVIEPHAFDWSGHNAAYYTLNDHNGMHALVIAVCLPEGDIMVFNISAPDAHMQRLRDELPRIMETVEIGDSHLEGAALDALPNPLPLPVSNTEN